MQHTPGFTTGLISLLAATVLLSACTTISSTTTLPAAPTVTTSASTAVVTSIHDTGTTSVQGGSLQSELATQPLAVLTEEEIDGLVWMREEEKLAHDVYTALYDLWNLQIFSNIASSEQTHTDAVKQLLDRYGIEDPAEGQPAGVFINPDIQRLYDDLVAQGSVSLEAALTVGTTIEDMDIYDLRQLSTATTDIAYVYANLEKGSRNHLRAFDGNLERRGLSYTPQFISQDEYETIVGSPAERGRDA